MTENEAQKWLERFELDDSEETSEALATICEALQEYPKFKAIGTAEGYERAIQSSVENYNLYREYKAKVQEYEAIGTVEDYWKLNEMCKEYSAIGTIEEFKALKEKAEPKKPIQQETTEKTHYKCPCCNSIMQTIYRDGVGWEHIADYCEWCGQKIDMD